MTKEDGLGLLPCDSYYLEPKLNVNLVMDVKDYAVWTSVGRMWGFKQAIFWTASTPLKAYLRRFLHLIRQASQESLMRMQILNAQPLRTSRR
jgi:hypothetical protein